MKNYIKKVNTNLNLQEGAKVIEQLLIECYINPGISTKQLARKILLPVPIAVAIKKEFIKAGILMQDRGVRCTREGIIYIENELGYSGLDKSLYKKLMDSQTDWKTELDDLLSVLTQLFQMRPEVNVQIDQSKCTPTTSLHRAILCLREHSLIGKTIICIGDDDLVSVSLGLLLKRLFPLKSPNTMITVVDIDERFLHYIHDIMKQEKLPINCHQIDLRQALSETLHGKFDCVFTDPPYTLQGMVLFVSRGIEAIKQEKSLPIFLSYAHKSPDFMLSMQREFIRMGLSIKEVILHFNEYEGAQMIGNKGQMIILKTTEAAKPVISGDYEDAIYTGEVKQILRTYECKQCRHSILVGIRGDFSTIEELKNKGCPICNMNKFRLIKRKKMG